MNLFIADDTGLGKTIEAGLIARELLLRRKTKTIVVATPPSVLEQWKAELEERFGLVFEILDRAYLTRMRRERGFGVNPWRTHSRFLVSHNLLIDPTYTDPMREWLGSFLPGSLLILDEAHHAAPASGGRYGIETKFTRAIRDLAGRFEHRLFLSATPHNGHSNSFSTLLELLDPYRFTRGVKVRGKKALEDVMVRRLLEGRTDRGARQIHERIEPPLVPDGTIYRALEKLLVLDGERISYRALDVEQIGSVYETMMGFRLETATGRSVAIRAQKRHGAPTAVDLEALLAAPADKRAKLIQKRADRELTDTVKKKVVEARTIADLHAALLPVIDSAATPDLVPHGAMVLQPSEERRRSGSHYTPRALTLPIVRTTLEPILSRLRGADGRALRPEQILDLKICDLAMGSGAFLVEACRQLGDALVEAWRAYGEMPAIPPDEDEVIFARRLIAQRCLYGVDRNPVAVDLAKVSLWLVTLAKDHPLTFLDHALRHGDSLVGLSRKQIEAFHWEGDAPAFQAGLETMRVREHVAKAAELRRRIRSAGESVSEGDLRDLWDDAQRKLSAVRLFSDLVLAAFFEAEKPKERETKRSEYAGVVVSGAAERHRDRLEEWRHAEPRLAPFHWEIDFPEVFERENPGFDAFVGNPPFAGKNSVAQANASGYPDWLKQLREESHGNADLVAHFFRRAFGLFRRNGAFGLIATNTIAQGDTRSTGLRWICTHGGEIFAARKRVSWPGPVSVVVSVMHVMKAHFPGPKLLDDRPVDAITAFLFHRGGHEDPARLAANSGKSFVGSYVLGMGFTFDDTDTQGIATPLAEMRRLLDKDPRNGEVIFPYIGGDEVNTSPIHAHHRYVINFGARSEEECRHRWPDLMAILEKRVKPQRTTDNRAAYRTRWWQFAEKRSELYAAIANLERVSVTSRVRAGLFTIMPARTIFSEQVVVFPLADLFALALLQSRVHELWMRFFSGTALELVRYAPTDCFETFPFPESRDSKSALEVRPTTTSARRSWSATTKA